jgi:hypothetical protein
MKSFIYGFLVLLFVTSCSNSSDKPIEDLFTSYVQSNKKIVAFGSLNVKQILTKAEYSSIPKYGQIIGTQIESFKNTINLDKPVFYALEGPLDRDGIPAAVYMFAEAKNEDSVVGKLKSLGYEMRKEEDLNYFHQGDFGMSVQKSLLLGVYKPNHKDFKGLFAGIHKQVKEEMKSDKISEIIHTKADVVAGVNLESMYGTSSTDLQKLPADKKALISNLVKDSYVLNTLNFNSGELVLQSKNYFSTALAQRMPLKQVPATNVLKNLGSGDPRIGLLLNMDFNRLKSLITDFGLQDELTQATNDLVSSDSSSVDILGTVFNGQFGAVVFEELMEEGGLTPSVNVLVGLGAQGKNQLDKLGIPGISLLQKEVFDSHALYYTSEKFKSANGSIKVPEGCANFGMKPISGFVYLNGMQMEDFDAEEEYKFIEKIDYLYFEFGIDGGVLRVKAIDDKTNILKQAIDQAISQLSEMLLRMVI